MTKEGERFDDVNHPWHYFFSFARLFFFLPQLLFFFCISSLSSFFYRLTSFFIQWIFIICNPHYPYCILSAMFRTAIIVSVVVAVVVFFLTKRSHRRKEKVTRNKRSCTKGKKKVAEVNVPSRPAYNTATYHYMCKSIKITIYKNYTFNIKMCQHCFTLWHHHKHISMVILFQWPISELLLASSSKQCSSFHLVISFYSHAKLTHFHTNGGATGLVLKKRQR